MRDTLLVLRVKLIVILTAAILWIVACGPAEPERYSIVASKEYEASLFRQHCAICHGPEGDGKILDDGTNVPSLRQGEFKRRSLQEIHSQISEGGNGMSPFRGQLSEREIRILTDLVNRLRNQP